MVAVGGEGDGMRLRRSHPTPVLERSAFVGFRFPPEIIVLGERGIEVDHVTVYRWVQVSRRCSRMLPARAAMRSMTVWYVDETYVKVAGTWRYVYRAVDQFGQIIDVLVSARRDLRAARRFFAGALRAHGEPVEVVTDRAPALRAAIEGPIVERAVGPMRPWKPREHDPPKRAALAVRRRSLKFGHQPQAGALSMYRRAPYSEARHPRKPSPPNRGKLSHRDLLFRDREGDCRSTMRSLLRIGLMGR